MDKKLILIDEIQRKPLTADELFCLFCFNKTVNMHFNENYRFLKDFHATKDLVQSYNKVISNPQPFLDNLVASLPIEKQKGYSFDRYDKMFNEHFPELSETLHRLLIVAYVSHNVHKLRTDNSFLSWDDIVSYRDIFTESLKFIAEAYFHDPQYRKPLIWTENLSKEEIELLEKGEAFECVISDAFKQMGINIERFFFDYQNEGENKIGVEIKFDEKSKDTHNFYFEYAEKHKKTQDKSFYPSGVIKNDNSYWFLIGVPGHYYILRRSDILAQIDTIDMNKRGWQNNMLVLENNSHRSMGILFKEDLVKRLAVATSVEEFVVKYGKELEHTSNYFKNPSYKYADRVLNKVLAKINSRNQISQPSPEPISLW